MLTGTAPEPPAVSPDLTGLALSVARARKDYAAGDAIRDAAAGSRGVFAEITPSPRV